MRRIALAMTLAGLTAVVPACNKKGDGGAGGAAGGGGKPAAAAASALDIFPENTAAIVGVNINKITTSKLWNQFGAKMLEDEETKANFALLKEKCGAEPMTDFQSIVFGVPDTGDNESMVVLVRGKFDEAKMVKCGTALAEKEGKKVTFKTEGKITEISTEGEEKKQYIGWAGADTIVIVPKAMEGDKAALEAVLAMKTSAKNNKELAPLLANVNTGETMWAAVSVQGKLAESMASSDGPKPKAGWATIAHAKDLKVDIGVRFANEKDAKDAAEKINKEIEGNKGSMPPVATDLLKGVKFEAKGTDLLVSINWSEADLDKIIEQVGPLLPMLMGGMMGGGGM
jgi:hypothetical protein